MNTKNTTKKPADKVTVDFNFDTFKASGETLTVVIGGQRHEIPVMDDLDGFEVIEAVSNGDSRAVIPLLQSILPDDAYTQLRKTAPTREALTDFVSWYFKANGLDQPGN